MASFIRKNELFFSTAQYQINSNLPLWTKEEMEKLKITPYVKNVSITEDLDLYEFNIALHKGFPAFTKMILFIYPEIKGKPFLEAPKHKLVIERRVSSNVKFILFDRGKTLEIKKDSISHRVSD
ncbi:MAG: hypothetical protein K6343_05060 [Caldisericaceae bacterium]